MGRGSGDQILYGIAPVARHPKTAADWAALDIDFEKLLAGEEPEILATITRSSGESRKGLLRAVARAGAKWGLEKEAEELNPTDEEIKRVEFTGALLLEKDPVLTHDPLEAIRSFNSLEALYRSSGRVTQLVANRTTKLSSGWSSLLEGEKRALAAYEEDSPAPSLVVRDLTRVVSQHAADRLAKKLVDVCTGRKWENQAKDVLRVDHAKLYVRAEANFQNALKSGSIDPHNDQTFKFRLNELMVNPVSSLAADRTGLPQALLSQVLIGSDKALREMLSLQEEWAAHRGGGRDDDQSD